jgi:aminocarboxymuconate-semialdehyde decarboxylase
MVQLGRSDPAYPHQQKHTQHDTAHRAIDIHTHMVPAHFPPYLGKHLPSGWPSMVPAQDCHRHVMIDDKVYRTVSDQCWDVSKRIADCDALGVGIQVVSPMPELLSYWLPIDDADTLARYLNDQLGEMVVQGGGRILALGSVPLGDVGRAIAELERIMRIPGFVGVEIGSNINGAPIGASQFDAFFEAAEALGAAIFVHALHPVGKERLVGPSQLMPTLAFPTDVGLAAASVICTNLMVKRPRLRIAFSHGGGTLALLLPRLKQGWRTFSALKDSIVMPPDEQARRLFYDALVFDAATLHHLADVFGDTQLMLGSDYPFDFRDSDPLGRLEATGFDKPACLRLKRGNAETFLNLHAGHVA